MLDVKQATAIVERELPGCDIQAVISFGGKFMFQVFTNRPGEEEMDPFYSVDMTTGEFRDFSILMGDTEKIIAEFVKAKQTR